jgi:hypothetical protein
MQLMHEEVQTQIQKTKPSYGKMSLPFVTGAKAKRRVKHYCSFWATHHNEIYRSKANLSQLSNFPQSESQLETRSRQTLY